MQPSDGRLINWTEDDKIYLALQMFQQRDRRSGSRLSAAQVLFEHLATYDPDWEDLPLPTGRTVAQSKAVFRTHAKQGSIGNFPQSAGPSPSSFNAALAGSAGAVTSRKRSAPADVLTPILGRLLAPKQPSTFGPDASSRPPVIGHQAISPLVDPSPQLHGARKKRGRPTKQEAEQRRRQMEERRQQRNTQSHAASLMQVQPILAGAHTAVPVPLIPPDQQALGFESSFERPLSSVPVDPGQTPPRALTGEQSSSSSSGKRRRLRISQPATIGFQRDPPPDFNLPALAPNPLFYHPPSHASGSSEANQPNLSTDVAIPYNSASASSGIPKTDVDEEARQLNPRSRPWEVSGS